MVQFQIVWSVKTVEERKAAVLRQFARWFGQEALTPQAYVEKDWVQDPWFIFSFFSFLCLF